MGKNENEPNPGPKYDTTAKPYSFSGTVKASFSQEKRPLGFPLKDNNPAPGHYKINRQKLGTGGSKF